MIGYTLVIASNNAHKVQEIGQMLKGETVTVVSSQDFFGRVIDVVEDGKTFAENARKKVTGLPAISSDTVIYLADDSGLEVDALNGRPGIFSARYAGKGASSAAMCTKLLNELKGERNRGARFKCLIALMYPSGQIELAEGTIAGDIVHEANEEKGFGYDPIFKPAGYEATFAEMDSETKNAISHRGQALSKTKEKLVKFLQNH